MKKTFLAWFIILLLCFVTSTFLHEVAHGACSYAVGIHVSTGFNKVGMPFKKPQDSDFRKGFFDKGDNPWDMGPATTLVLAIGFTVAFLKSKSKNKYAAMLLAAFALCNSLIRLIPMLHSYAGLLVRGSFFMEDEIGTGISWYNLCGLEIMRYIPSLISIAVSLICIYFIIRALKIKLPDLFAKRVYFAAGLVAVYIAYIAAFQIETILDNMIRINW